jgi:hypothetical protein
MLLYKNKRLSINTDVLHYKEFNVDQLEFLCDTMKKVKFLRKLDPDLLYCLADVEFDWDEIN